MVAFQRECLFGKIVDGEMQLNEFGRIADECWRAIPEHFPNVDLVNHIIMPNHIHGIIVIHNADSIEATTAEPFPSVGTRHASSQLTSPQPRLRGTPSGSLGAIVGSFKSAVTKRIGWELMAKEIWQRNYYERIIRNEREMDRIWRYIESNPSRWTKDRENLLKVR